MDDPSNAVGSHGRLCAAVHESRGAPHVARPSMMGIARTPCVGPTIVSPIRTHHLHRSPRPRRQHLHRSPRRKSRHRHRRLKSLPRRHLLMALRKQRRLPHQAHPQQRTGYRTPVYYNPARIQPTRECVPGRPTPLEFAAKIEWCRAESFAPTICTKTGQRSARRKRVWEQRAASGQWRVKPSVSSIWS